MFRSTMMMTALVALLVAVPALADNTVDVTDKVAAMVKDNALTVVASNDNFTDPADGIVKKLTVEYTVDGAAGRRSVSENATLAITVAAGKKLVIKKATYGDVPEQADIIPAGDTTPAAAPAAPVPATVDVTDKVKAALKDNKVTINAGNDAMGGDPASGIVKQLKVEYTVDGKPHTATANEGDDLNLPAAADGAGTLVITKATYGSPPAN